MKKCPVCQTRFKDTTTKCRYCGVMLETAPSSSASQKKTTAQYRRKGKKAPSVPVWQTTLRNKWKKYWYWVYIICFFIIVASVGVHYLSKNKDFIQDLRLSTSTITERPSIEVSNTTTPLQDDVTPETDMMPKSADAYDWFNKAFYLCRSGKCIDNAKAIEFLDKAIKLKPDYAEAFNNRGIAYADSGQYQNAIENYNEAIRIKPQRAESFNNRGMAYASIGQYKRAIEDYDQAIKLKPNYSMYNNRGSAYTNLYQNQRAIEDYNEAIRLKPDNADLYANRGLAYFNLDNHQSAIENYSEAIRLKPNSADIYNDRGTAYLAQGNKDSGCQDLYRACELGQCESLEKSKNKGICP